MLSYSSLHVDKCVFYRILCSQTTRVKKLKESSVNRSNVSRKKVKLSDTLVNFSTALKVNTKSSQKGCKTSRKKVLKESFRKDLYEEALEKLRQENTELRAQLEDRDRQLKEKDVYVMTTLEEAIKQHERQQHHYQEVIAQLKSELTSQQKCLGKV